MVLTKAGSILGPIATVLGYVMDILFRFTSSFGVFNVGLCIILFTIVMKTLMIPLTIKQQKTTKLMSVMNPAPPLTLNSSTFSCTYKLRHIEASYRLYKNCRPSSRLNFKKILKTWGFLPYDFSFFSLYIHILLFAWNVTFRSFSNKKGEQRFAIPHKMYVLILCHYI